MFNDMKHNNSTKAKRRVWFTIYKLIPDSYEEDYPSEKHTNRTIRSIGIYAINGSSTRAFQSLKYSLVIKLMRVKNFVCQMMGFVPTKKQTLRLRKKKSYQELLAIDSCDKEQR